MAVKMERERDRESVCFFCRNHFIFLSVLLHVTGIIINGMHAFTCEGVTAKSVTAEPVACTAMSMTFFDQLYDGNVVRESGHIVKCFDDFCQDFIISDELRKACRMLLMSLLQHSYRYLKEDIVRARGRESPEC